MPVYVGDALYAHANGGCYRCARGDSLVDLDVQIQGEGALAICKHCIAEAAEAAGLHLNIAAISEMRLAHQEEARQFGPERVADLEAELAETKAALAAALEVDKILDEIRTAAQGPKVDRRPAR